MPEPLSPERLAEMRRFYTHHAVEYPQSQIIRDLVDLLDALDRVTDDSMAEQIKAAVGDGFETVRAYDGYPSIRMRSGEDLARDVLASIRAVVAVEQAEGDSDRRMTKEEALNDLADALEFGPRPAGCCGKCPPIEGGGYDCTCTGNPRCENSDV